MKEEKSLIHIIAQNVYVRRKKKQMSIPALAEASGVSKNRISDLENENLNNVTINTIALLSGALECDAVSLLTPISGDEYANMGKDMLGPEEECELSTCIHMTKLQKTYYPPLAEFNKISSMTELVLILPLLDPADQYENHFRIAGQTIGREEYVSHQFDYSWKHVPDSPAKRYVEKELRIISERRAGNTDFDIPMDEEYKAEYEAYEKLVTEKRQFVNDLKSAIKHYSFSEI